MYQLSARSKQNVGQLDDKLQLIVNEAIQIIDFAVTCGHRNKHDQTEAFKKGLSKLQFPNSKHNSLPSMAMDVAPYPIDYNDTKRFYYLAGILMGIAAKHKIKLRWGGDWDMDNNFKNNTFQDLPHFELVD